MGRTFDGEVWVRRAWPAAPNESEHRGWVDRDVKGPDIVHICIYSARRNLSRSRADFVEQDEVLGLPQAIILRQHMTVDSSNSSSPISCKITLAVKAIYQIH